MPGAGVDAERQPRAGRGHIKYSHISFELWARG
jgi:hypothetical protein